MDFFTLSLVDPSEEQNLTLCGSKKARNDLNEDETQARYLYLVKNPIDGKLSRGTVNDHAAEEFGVTRRTVSCIRA